MEALRNWLDRRLYADQARYWEDALFRQRLDQRGSPSSRVLEVGAGPGEHDRFSLRGRVAVVHGVDPDERVLQNPHLDGAWVADGTHLPLPDRAYDLVFAAKVLEHVADPAALFREVARVLRPGGRFLVLTPNARHYSALAARILPAPVQAHYHRVHGRAGADVHPVCYRANRPAVLRGLAAQAGLVTVELTLHEGRPEYLRFHGLLYLAGALYERTVNALKPLAPLRAVILAEFRRPPTRRGSPAR